MSAREFVLLVLGGAAGLAAGLALCALPTARNTELGWAIRNDDGVGYFSTREAEIEGFDETMVRRYSPSDLHREIHAFCELVRGLL